MPYEFKSSEIQMNHLGFLDKITLKYLSLTLANCKLKSSCSQSAVPKTSSEEYLGTW